MFKRFFVIAVLLAVILGAVGAQQTIRIGYFDNGPYVLGQPGGKPPVGSAVDYWNTIVAPAMNVKVEWVGPTPMLRLLNQVKSGDVDAVLIVARNAEREKVMSYAATPFIKFQPGIAVLKDNALDVVKNQDDIAGMRLGTSEGAIVSDFVKSAKVTWDNVSTATWMADCLTKAANKRIDGVFNLGVVGLQYEASQGYPGKFKFLALPVPGTDIYTAFSRTDRGAAFLKLYDPVNTKNASAMDALTRKYIGAN